MARIHDHQERLAALVAELAQENVKLAETTAAYDTKKAETDALLEPFKVARDDQDAKVKDLRARIQAEGLLVEKDDLHPALSRVENTVITFEDAAMFKWCRDWNPGLLELNRSNVTQYVNWVLGSKTQTMRFFGTEELKPLIPMPVKVEKVPAIEIKKKLAAWIPQPEPEPEPEKAEGEPAPPPAEPAPTAFPGGTPDDFEQWLNQELAAPVKPDELEQRIDALFDQAAKNAAQAGAEE